MIPRFLESVRTVKSDCEILVVDNASTDATSTFVAMSAAKDPRIRYVRNEENIGVIANYNLAMELARGEYVCCMGDDDATLPGNFERKIALLDANPKVGLVYSQWLRMDENGRSLGVCAWPGLLRHSYVGGRAEFLDLLPACYIHLQSVVFRRELFEKHGGADLRPEITAGQDWDMLLRWINNTETAYIAEPLVGVGVHAQSQTESVCRTNGHFAKRRIAIWRKWLVESQDPPVLDDGRWQRMRDAFMPVSSLRIRRRSHYDRRVSRGAGGHSPREQIEDRSAVRAHDWPLLHADSARTIPGRLARSSGMRRCATQADTRTRRATSCLPWMPPNRACRLRQRSPPIQAWRRAKLRWNDRSAVLPPDRDRILARLLAAPDPPDSVHVWHILASHFQTEAAAAANVGRTMFETDRLPDGWAEACNRMELGLGADGVQPADVRRRGRGPG